IGPTACERVGDVVAVEMDFECLVADLHAFQELLLHVRHTGGGHHRRYHVHVGVQFVVHRAGFDDARPADGAGHAVAALPVGVLLAAKGRGTAIGPTGYLGTVVGGIHDDGVFIETE